MQGHETTKGISKVGYQVKDLVRKVNLLHYIGNNRNPLFPLSPGPPRSYKVPS